jgi:hypothetical protein
MVNDSDSWHYVLFGFGSQIDAFDSSGGFANEYEMDEISPELAQTLLGGELEDRMHEMQQQIEDEMPDDIRDIQQRIHEGTATQEEMQQFGQWLQTQSQRFMGELNELMPGMAPSFGRPSVPQVDLTPHVKKLRPVLPRVTKNSLVLQILGKQAVFAEEILREFMELIGVQSTFADLSYRYHEEFTEADLLGANINMLAHLKFRTDAISS